jgi:hypothetical protein
LRAGGANSIFVSWLTFLLVHTDFKDRVTAARRAHSPHKLKSKGRDSELKLLGGHCGRPLGPHAHKNK